MIINLSDVVASEGKIKTVTAEYKATAFSSKMGDFPIIQKEEVPFTFTNIGNKKVRVQGSAKFIFDNQCDRCLEEVPVEIFLEFDRDISIDDDYTEKNDSDDDFDFMEGCHLDVEVFIQNEILMNWPMKVLCKPECKGICSVCGANLNKVDCGCDTFVPDPRMAVIQDIFNANKEV